MPQCSHHPDRRQARRCFPALMLLGCVALGSIPGRAAPAEPSYPFEGTWIRSDRMCVPKATLVRTYTARDVASSRSHCSVRRVAGGSGTFELFEECRRNDRPMKVTETIHMLSPDLMTLKRQLVRLKIPRAVRFARCTAAAPVVPNRPH